MRTGSPRPRTGSDLLGRGGHAARHRAAVFAPAGRLGKASFATFVLITALVSAAALASYATAAQPPKPPQEALLQHVGAIVEVRTTAVSGAESSATLGAERSGSGTILDPSTVLTIGYLLLEADQVEIVTASGRKIPGSVAAYDQVTGLGIVRAAVPLEGKPVELGDSDSVLEQQRVLTLGHSEPMATEILVISRKPFAGSWEYLLDRAIFTFPPVNNWSGAALLSGEGKLVGIGSLMVNDAASGQKGVPGNMFVPINELKPVIHDLLEKGRRDGPARPWLGLGTETVRGNLMVSRVTEEGPADEAGLQPGDIILAVGDAQVADQAELYRRIWGSGPAGTEITLRILQDGAVRSIKVRSVDRADFLRKPGGI
jgi:serine protease Do